MVKIDRYHPRCQECGEPQGTNEANCLLCAYMSGVLLSIANNTTVISARNPDGTWSHTFRPRDQAPGELPWWKRPLTHIPRWLQRRP